MIPTVTLNPERQLVHRITGAEGLVPRVPYVRASDWDTYCHCPFRYFLRRRLGLVRSFERSAALNYGSWFHVHAEETFQPPQVVDVQGRFAARAAELKATAAVLDISLDKLRTVVETEERQMLEAGAWWEAVKEVPIAQYGTAYDFLRQRSFRCLGTELGLRLRIAGLTGNRPFITACRLDMLLYNEEQNTLWIPDWKTCAEPTDIRLSTAPLEFQTWHYLKVVGLLLSKPELIRKWGLKPDAKLGGMIHIAVQKPTISFGSKDRPFREETRALKSGPRKGQLTTERIYEGEPSYPNYIARVKDWYLARGEYTHLASERLGIPPVNISFTKSAVLLDPKVDNWYHGILKRLANASQCAAHLDQFPPSARHLREYGRLDQYAPFYDAPMEDWPRLADQLGFLVDPPDDTLDYLT